MYKTLIPMQEKIGFEEAAFKISKGERPVKTKMTILGYI